MLTLRKASDRGHADHGWLDSHHTFSFGDYHDPGHMGYSVLRVINDDRVAAGGGFPQHGHRDMEIISYVLDGALAHKDNTGTNSVIAPGDVQRMSAGRGVQHSEFNASKSDPVHFLQIWIVPAERGLPASYEQKSFTDEERRGKFRLVASPDGAEGSVVIHQDARLYATLLDAGQEARLALAKGRRAWVQVARGGAELGALKLQEGDGVAVEGEESLKLRGTGPSEILVFDLP